MKIGNRNIGSEFSPFIIAELSGNHNGSLDRALEIVDAAAAAGAHALKLQTYTAETMTIDLAEREFFISDPKSLWKGNSLFELYRKAHTPWDWHEKIFQRAKERGILCFSSPFDSTAVDLLESLDAPAYKVASFENTDLALIKRVAETGKPMFISTGMASLAEIEEAVMVVKATGNTQLVLLKCTSTYPSTADGANLATIPHLRFAFGSDVGLSDHTLGIGVAVASVALGAVAIEKHFTLDREDGGVDSAFSLDPKELSLLVSESDKAFRAIGKIHFGPLESEVPSLAFRRTLYVVEDMKAGEVFSQKNIRAIRPGGGLPPKFMNVVLGKRASRSIARGTGMSWDLLL